MKDWPHPDSVDTFARVLLCIEMYGTYNKKQADNLHEILVSSKLEHAKQLLIALNDLGYLSR